MPYNKQIWEDLPNKTTPLSAERLNHLEKQYDEAVKDAKSYTDNAISNIPPPEFLGVGSINGVGETDMWLELDPRISGPLTSGNAVFAFCGSSTTRRGEWVNGFMDQVFHRFGKGEVLNISEASEVDMGTGIYGVISGFSGGKAGDYLDSDKAEAISDLNPNVVFHMVGSSDWAVGTPLDSYRINLNNAINRISSSNPILHVLIHSFERMDSSSRVLSWSDYGNEMFKVSKMGENRIYVNVADTFKRAGVFASGGNEWGFMSQDMVHFTPEAGTVLGGVIADRLHVQSEFSSGWVDLSSFLTPGFSVSGSGFVMVRRQGSVVELSFQDVNGTIESYTSTNILENLPDWFLPRGRHVWGTCWGGSSGNGVLGDVVVRSDNNNNVGVVMDKSASKIRGSVIYTLP